MILVLPFLAVSNWIYSESSALAAYMYSLAYLSEYVLAR